MTSALQQSNLAYDLMLHILRIRARNLCSDACKFLEREATDEGGNVHPLHQLLGICCLQLAALSMAVEKRKSSIGECQVCLQKLSELALTLDRFEITMRNSPDVIIPTGIQRELASVERVLLSLKPDLSYRGTGERPDLRIAS